MKTIMLIAIMGCCLAGCGAGDTLSGGSSGSIRSTDYALPTALPSVPDQSAKQ